MEYPRIAKKSGFGLPQRLRYKEDEDKGDND